MELDVRLYTEGYRADMERSESLCRILVDIAHDTSKAMGPDKSQLY